MVTLFHMLLISFAFCNKLEEKCTYVNVRENFRNFRIFSCKCENDFRKNAKKNIFLSTLVMK
jgi:hypothetical protein